MRQAVVDRWLGAILMGLAAIWCGLVETTISADRMEGAPGPRAFPLLLGEILFALGAIMVVLSLVAPAAAAGAPAREPTRRDEIAIVGGGVGLFLLYAFLMEKIGFLLATPVIVMLALRGVLGLRGWLRIAVVAAALTIGCDLLFADLLQANLPQGTWLSLGGD
jgi:putative tricarboxylic transport membrane protein